jgi:hypothetical protein
MYDDEESGLRIKRLWSFRDRDTGERFYHDIAELSVDRRRKLIRQYAHFSDQMRSVRRAMADYFAGQGFFDFFTGLDVAGKPAIQHQRGHREQSASDLSRSSRASRN